MNRENPWQPMIMQDVWEFWIDVGGTFTDCLARGPAGEFRTAKVLSSGITKGRMTALPDTTSLHDPLRRGDPEGFWTGATCSILDENGQAIESLDVTGFHARQARLQFRQPLSPAVVPGLRYELKAGIEAPILAIRTILAIPLPEPLPAVRVRLGTTRGTNALLTRRGANTGFVTTRGFRDVLLIANQDRPRLFDLAIRKPEPLFSRVAEIDERLDASGTVLRAPDPSVVRQQLQELRSAGCEAVAS